MTELRDSSGSPITHAPIPTVVDFPYPSATPEDGSNTSAASLPRDDDKTSVKSLTSTGDTKGRMPEPTAGRPGVQGLKRMETAPAAQSNRPLNARAATERPQVVTKNSLVASKRRPVFKPVQRLSHRSSYRFEPPSDTDSDSSSDSSDDEQTPIERVLSAQNGTQNAQEQKKPQLKKATHSYRKFSVGNEEYHTKGRVSRKDGRLKISIKEHAKDGYLAQTLAAGLKRHFKRAQAGNTGNEEAEKKAPLEEQRPIPSMNVVIMVIGSRGDIQPFIKIGKILKEQYGHRVRIATHPAFKKFIEKDSGLEFFSVGGDPSELMAFMVKNPGLIPNVDTIRQGEIGRRRAQMFEMFQGMWRACINATDDETDKANQKMMGLKSPFVADVIIANPPSFAHVHIAERLGIPVHMMFTFPYSPTTSFPHPLANIRRSNVDPNYTNFMSYPLVDMMTWQGLGDLVNRFREKTLGLEPVSTLWAPGSLYRQKVPYTYMWSPGLVPKPADWGPEIEVTGFVFLELASTFKPPDDLARFLDAGPPPVYIGFGSIVVDDPEAFTQMIFEAVEKAGVRALVNKGWGGLGGNGDAPDNVFMLGNTPHDWLFPRVAAVIHHGGAGTTAIGLKLARPTMIVPFFGDQPFWGAMVATAKAGAHECIPFKDLDADKLAEGIKQCLTEEAKVNAQKIADSIEAEGDGAGNAVKSFHRALQLRGDRSMRCSILDERVAVWHVKGTKLRLSALTADILVDRKKIKWSDLRLIRHNDWTDFGGPGEPITGGGSAIVNSVADAAIGVGSIPVNMARKFKKREAHNKKKKRLQERQEKVKQANAAEAEAQVAQAEKGALEDPAARPGVAREETDPFLNKRPGNLRRTSTTLSKLSADPSETIAETVGDELAHGFGQTGRAIVKGPMNLSLAVAQGFHNAPRLYGDPTVRRVKRISGFHSGLRAGRDEFVYGIYDAWSGLVTQPYYRTKEDGAVGLVRGVGMGLGGFVLKNISALLGPGAYTVKGVHKEIQKRRQPTNILRRARILQGHLERLATSEHDLEEAESTVFKGWDMVADVLQLREEKIKEEKNRKKFHMGDHHAFHDGAGEDREEKTMLAERMLHANRLGMSLEEYDRENGTEGAEKGMGAEYTSTERKSMDKGEKRGRPSTVQERDEIIPAEKSAQVNGSTRKPNSEKKTQKDTSNVNVDGANIKTGQVLAVVAPDATRARAGSDTKDFASPSPGVEVKPIQHVSTVS